MEAVAQARKADFSEVPVIDIAPLIAREPAATARVAAQIRAACESAGFFYIKGHGVADVLLERTLAASRAFFALPEAERLEIKVNQWHRGFVPAGQTVLGKGLKPDLKESFNFSVELAPDDPDIVAGKPLAGPNQWPDLPGFREDVMAYYAAAFSVGRRLLRGFAMALGRNADSFDHLVATPPSQLRLVHYPYAPDTEDAPGIGAHTDYECFTLLLASEPGLEVMSQAGTWIDVPPVPGALTVNIGDMLEFWSDGALVATSHRVRKVAQERYSFPLFFALDYDVELAPLRRSSAPIRTGEHLYAQTVQTFRYLRQRAERGEVALPDASRPLASFGREARRTTA